MKWMPVSLPNPFLKPYILSPQEHRKRLIEGAIRCLVQLQERWRDCPQETEQELAFAELSLHRIRREMP